jgi:hypothetical protein
MSVIISFYLKYPGFSYGYIVLGIIIIMIEHIILSGEYAYNYLCSTFMWCLVFQHYNYKYAAVNIFLTNILNYFLGLEMLNWSSRSKNKSISMVLIDSNKLHQETVAIPMDVLHLTSNGYFHFKIAW